MKLRAVLFDVDFTLCRPGPELSPERYARIAGRHVLVIEDIVDSGLTLSWLLKYLESRSAESVEVVALLRKPDAVKVEVDVRYVGFDIPNEFVVGYGLDFAERYRELPYIGVLRPSVYSRV